MDDREFDTPSKRIKNEERREAEKCAETASD